ncbi:MAG: HAD hydrolase family protein [Dehalococcoidia bacterium]
MAGASFAMGQASDDVKQHATGVTLPNSEDGVAVAVERLLETGEVGPT